MLTTNRVSGFSSSNYSKDLVYNLLAERRIKDLEEITEKLFKTAPEETVREYNRGTHEFIRHNGTGRLRRLGLCETGVYIAEFKYARIVQQPDEDCGKLEIICPSPEFN